MLSNDRSYIWFRGLTFSQLYFLDISCYLKKLDVNFNVLVLMGDILFIVFGWQYMLYVVRLYMS